MAQPAARSELEAARVPDQPEVVLADAGYWHHEQMTAIIERGIELLIPPDSSRRKAPGLAGKAAAPRPGRHPLRDSLA